MASHSTPCLRFVEIGCIDLDGEHHAAFSIREYGVRLCRCIIEDFFISSLCSQWALIFQMRWKLSPTTLSRQNPWHNTKMYHLVAL